MQTAVITGGTRGVSIKYKVTAYFLKTQDFGMPCLPVPAWRMAAAGIGLAIANCMARNGFNLILGFHTNRQAAEAKVQLETDHSVKVVVVSGDIAVPATMQQLFRAVQDNFGNQCTAFIHNAGLYIGITTNLNDAQPTDDADFDKTWDYYQKVYPQAFKRGLLLAQKCDGLKHVLAISSLGCNATMPPRVKYEDPGQAKAAVEFLVRVNASALASHGINVNCVIAGFTRTEAWERVAERTGQSAEELAHFADQTPSKRWAEPSEIGEAVAFLCSAKGSFITGVSLPVDGGQHLQHASFVHGSGPPKKH